MSKLKVDDSAKIILLSILAQMVLALPISLFAGDAQLFIGFLLPQLAYIFIVIIYLKIKKTPILSVIPVRKKTPPLSILIVAIITIGVFMQNLILVVGFNWIMDALGVTMTVSVPPFDTAFNIIMSIIIIAIMPAIGEEMVFRGVLLTTLKERGMAYAVLMSAVIFSLSHLNPAQLIHQFLLGIILAYITIQTGNIIFASIIHFINNVMALSLPYLIPPINSLMVVSSKNILIMLAMSIIGIIILYPSIKLLIKTNSQQVLDKKQLSFIRFFIKEKQILCYNKNESVIPQKRLPSLWLTVLIAVLIVGMIFSTILLAFPQLGQL